MKFKTWSRSKPSPSEEEVVQVVSAQSVKQQRQVSSYKKRSKSNVSALDITHHGSTDYKGNDDSDNNGFSGRDNDDSMSINSCSSFSSASVSQSHHTTSKRRATYSFGDSRKNSDTQKTAQEIPQTVLTAATTNTRRNNHASTNRRGHMRSKSLSRRELMAQSCACFAPLPDYAKYKERKIQRELSRTCIFTSEPSSPLQVNESRESNKQLIRSKSLDLSDAIARQPSSPMIHPAVATPNSDETSASSPFKSGGNARASKGLFQQSIKRKEAMVSSISPPQLELLDTPLPKNYDTALVSAPPTTPLPTLSRDKIESSQKTIQIEVSPGMTMELRNVEETMMAIRNNFFVPVACLGCSLNDMVCIADAEYVLCPTCRVVSPILMMGRQRDPKGQPPKGLGLGVRYENLVAIQSEIKAADPVVL